MNRSAKVVKHNHVPDHSNKLAAMQIESIGRLILEKAYSVSKRILKLTRNLDVAMNKYMESNGKDSTERKRRLDEVTPIKDELQKLNLLKEQCSDAMNSLYSMVQSEFENSYNAAGADNSNSKSNCKKNDGSVPGKEASSTITQKTNDSTAIEANAANAPAATNATSQKGADSNVDTAAPTNNTLGQTN